MADPENAASTERETNEALDKFRKSSDKATETSSDDTGSVGHDEILREVPDSGDTKLSNEQRKRRIEAETKRLEAETKEAETALLYRKLFLPWCLGIVTFCVVVSSCTVGSLFWYGGYREMGNVLIAFIGSLAVEVVGIAVIVAKYLFPDGGPRHDSHDAEPDGGNA